MKDFKFKGKKFTNVIGMPGDEVFRLVSPTWRASFFVPSDCCNNGWLDDIDGDINDLIDSPITKFEIVKNYDEDFKSNYPDNMQNSVTWTFIKIDTEKGGVTLRFCGTSNGYYSEDVKIYVANKKNR